MNLTGIVEAELVDAFPAGWRLTAGADRASVRDLMDHLEQSVPSIPRDQLAREATPAELELAELHEQVDAYDARLDQLEHRLRGVLRGDRPGTLTDLESHDVPDRSAMVATLDTLGELMRQHNGRLGVLMDRLDV